VAILPESRFRRADSRDEWGSNLMSELI